MTTPFSLDDASSSRMMSMAERQNQLVLQRRQMIRQRSQVNSNLSRRKVEASDYGNGQPPAAHHQVANCTASDKIVVQSPSEMSCTSTVVVKKQSSSDEPKQSENCDENSNDADKENQEAMHLLQRELDRKKKETKEEKKKAEADRLCKENESRRRELQLHASSADDVIKDNSSTDDTRHEIANVSSSMYSSGRSTMGGSDSGYQRYLDAYHHQPKESLLTREPSDTTRETSTYLTAASDISDLSGSRRLSSTSYSRPISRATRRSQESSSSVATPKTVSSTTVPTQQSSTKASETESLEEVSKNQEQEQHPTKKSDSQSREPSLSRSLPSLQQQLTSIGNANLDDPVVMRSILMNPCPKDGGMVQCCIRRNKGKATLGIGLYPEYRVYLRENNNSRTETFLMTAKKRPANKTSNYLISMGRNDHDKDSKNILGKLRGDCKEYILYDNGKNPDDRSQDGKNDKVRIELGAVLYASSSLGNKGPRTISVGISNNDDEGNPVKVWQPLHKRDDSMLDYLKKIDGDEVSSKDKKLLIHLKSKPPAWDEALERFFLNFNGRVTMASVKNFQLIDESGDMCLQFGRTGKDEFILDVKWPLSPFQAFALALSSFDSKVGCD